MLRSPTEAVQSVNKVDDPLQGRHPLRPRLHRVRHLRRSLPD